MSEALEMTEEQATEATPKMAKKVQGISADSTLTVLAESNPKKANSKAFDMYELYATLPEGATVKDAKDAGISMADIHYNVIHGYIDVEGAEVVEYEVSPRGPRKPRDLADKIDEEQIDDTAFENEGENEGDSF